MILVEKKDMGLQRLPLLPRPAHLGDTGTVVEARTHPDDHIVQTPNLHVELLAGQPYWFVAGTNGAY